MKLDDLILHVSLYNTLVYAFILLMNGHIRIASVSPETTDAVNEIFIAGWCAIFVYRDRAPHRFKDATATRRALLPTPSVRPSWPKSAASLS